MEGVLEKSLLGNDNWAALDFNVFVEKQEFRKSGHFAWNKIAIRVQESSNDKLIRGEIWKRFATGEQIDLRPNYGQTV